MSIYQKAQQFANSIRRQQRQQYKRQRRKILLLSSPQHISINNHNNIQKSFQNIPQYSQVIKNLHSKINQSLSLTHIYMHLTHPSSNYTILIFKLFQSGIHIILINYLQQKQFIIQTLKILSFILSRQNLKYAERLVSRGLLQILIEMIEEKAKNGYKNNQNNLNNLNNFNNFNSLMDKNNESLIQQLVLNIIGNVCIEDEQNCQIILQNRKYHVFIELFNLKYNKLHVPQLKNQLLPFNSHDNINKQDQKYLKSLLWQLTDLCSMKHNYQLYDQQFTQILNFGLQLLSKLISQQHQDKYNLIQLIIGLFYQICIKQYSSSNKQHINKITVYLNRLLQIQSGDSYYLNGLLILILHLSPIDSLKYSFLIKFSFKIKYDIFKLIIKIIDKVLLSQKQHYYQQYYQQQDQYNIKQSSQIRQFKHILLTNQQWWQYTLCKIQSQGNQFKYIITILRKLSLNLQCVWRFISEYLEDVYEKYIINEILLFIRNILINSKNYQEIYYKMKKYRIIKKLELLVTNENNIACSDKANQLLMIIQDTQKQYKEKFGIEIQ